jgi:predicted nuclease of predicted toxin-antitoxin system
MTFFLDENFPKAATALLVSLGHTVLDIRGTGDEGAEDPEIFALAQEKRAVFLTTDRDFFHTIPHLFADHHGVVVIALRRPNRQAVLGRLSWFLNHVGNRSLAGRAYLLRERTYAVYPAPGQRPGPGSP